MKNLGAKTFLPVTFVFHPEWWHRNYGLSFEREFFYDADTRVEVDLVMRRILNERFAGYGLEQEENPEPRPCIGAVHLAAGYIISELFGCQVEYSKNASPQVIPKNISDEEADNLEPVKLAENAVFQELRQMVETLKQRFGYVVGDINWQGVLNVALDLRGEKIFIDLIQYPERAKRIFSAVTETIKEFVTYIRKETGTTSIAVNRSIKWIEPKLNVHSNCSVIMISPDTYRQMLLPYDQELARTFKPYGIHHCGRNMQLYADAYAEIPEVCFFDVGWGSDLALCRQKLPQAFLNLRYDPVKIRNAEPEEIRADLLSMLQASADPEKTGICCINMDHDVPDENIATVIQTVAEYRKEILNSGR
ncbi:MAG: hypothetical protein GX050_06685 [Firmicutes bacterium]|nr:hypothetical protein [Bacillota bacterium]